MSAPVVRRRTVVAFAIATLVLLAALLTVVARQAGEWLRPRLEAALQERLVPQVRIAGPLELDLWPAPGARVRGLTLIEGSGATPLVVDELTVRLDAARLARGEPALQTIDVSGLTLTLRREAAGWNIARWLREGDASGGSGVPPIGRIAVTDATIRLEGAGELAGLRLSFGPIAPGTDGALEASARARAGEPSRSELALTLSAGYRLDRDTVVVSAAYLAAHGAAGDWQVREAALRAPTLSWRADEGLRLEQAALTVDAAREGTTLALETSLAGLEGQGARWHATAVSVRLDASGEGQAFGLRLAAPQAESTPSGWDLPEFTADLSGGGDQAFAVALSGSAAGPAGDASASVTVTAARATVPHPAGGPAPLALRLAGTSSVRAAPFEASGTLAGKFDETRFQGDWRFDPAAVPRLRARLALDRLALDRYLPAPRPGAGPPDLTAWRDWPLAAELEIGALRYQGMTAEQARLRLSGRGAVTDGR